MWRGACALWQATLATLLLTDCGRHFGEQHGTTPDVPVSQEVLVRDLRPVAPDMGNSALTLFQGVCKVKTIFLIRPNPPLPCSPCCHLRRRPEGTVGRHGWCLGGLEAEAPGRVSWRCVLRCQSEKKKKKKPLSFKHVFDEELKIINFIKSTLENTSV